MEFIHCIQYNIISYHIIDIHCTSEFSSRTNTYSLTSLLISSSSFSSPSSPNTHHNISPHPHINHIHIIHSNPPPHFTSLLFYSPPRHYQHLFTLLVSFPPFIHTLILRTKLHLRNSVPALHGGSYHNMFICVIHKEALPTYADLPSHAPLGIIQREETAC